MTQQEISSILAAIMALGERMASLEAKVDSLGRDDLRAEAEVVDLRKDHNDLKATVGKLKVGLGIASGAFVAMGGANLLGFNPLSLIP